MKKKRTEYQHPPFLQFLWTVNHGGHRLIESKDAMNPQAQQDRYVMVNPAETKREYTPLSLYPNLYDTFSGLRSDEDFLAFANIYGLLTHGDFIGHPDGLTQSALGEPLSLWQDHSTWMSDTVSIWKDVQTKNTRALKEKIKWQSRTSVVRSIRPIHIIASERRHPERLQVYKFGDVIAPAVGFIQDRINEVLKDHTCLQLMRPPKGYNLNLYMQPKTLIGALWVQLSYAVIGQKEFRKCKNESCPTPIEISKGPLGKQITREFCSNRCKMIVQRKKMTEAKRLSERGWSVKKIADAVGSTKETITEWAETKRWGKRRGN